MGKVVLSVTYCHSHAEKTREKKCNADGCNMYFLFTEPSIRYASQWEEYHSKLRTLKAHL